MTTTKGDVENYVKDEAMKLIGQSFESPALYKSPSYDDMVVIKGGSGLFKATIVETPDADLFRWDGTICDPFVRCLVTETNGEIEAGTQLWCSRGSYDTRDCVVQCSFCKKYRHYSPRWDRTGLCGRDCNGSTYPVTCKGLTAWNLFTAYSEGGVKGLDELMYGATRARNYAKCLQLIRQSNQGTEPTRDKVGSGVGYTIEDNGIRYNVYVTSTETR